MILNDLQRSKYPIHSLLPGVYGLILSLRTVFPIHSLGQISGTHPSAENIDNVKMVLKLTFRDGIVISFFPKVPMLRMYRNTFEYI